MCAGVVLCTTVLSPSSFGVNGSIFSVRACALTALPHLVVHSFGINAILRSVPLFYLDSAYFLVKTTMALMASQASIMLAKPFYNGANNLDLRFFIFQAGLLPGADSSPGTPFQERLVVANISSKVGNLTDDEVVSTVTARATTPLAHRSDASLLYRRPAPMHWRALAQRACSCYPLQRFRALPTPNARGMNNTSVASGGTLTC